MVKKLIILMLIALAISFIDKYGMKSNADKSVERTWTVMDSKAYAKDVLYNWADKQYDCLNKLWTQESNWRTEAYNKVKIMGKNAGGIPQLLGMSPDTPAPIQIDRGLAYIKYRYTTPCRAWAFHQARGWY